MQTGSGAPGNRTPLSKGFLRPQSISRRNLHWSLHWSYIEVFNQQLTVMHACASTNKIIFENLKYRYLSVIKNNGNYSDYPRPSKSGWYASSTGYISRSRQWTLKSFLSSTQVFLIFQPASLTKLLKDLIVYLWEFSVWISSFFLIKIIQLLAYS